MYMYVYVYVYVYVHVHVYVYVYVYVSILKMCYDLSGAETEIFPGELDQYHQWWCPCRHEEPCHR